MYEKSLFWMEVISISGRAHEAIVILKRTIEWLDLKVCCSLICHGIYLMLAGQTLDPNNKLTLFIHDTLQFVLAFIIPISKNALYIYLSALPFVPKHSLIAEKFSSRFPNMLTVTESRPAQQLFTIFIAEHNRHSVQCFVFSPDKKILASISNYNVYVCDSETGHPISGPFQLKYCVWFQAAYFCPIGTNILVRDYDSAVIQDIKRSKEQFTIEGRDFVFIQCGRQHSSIVSFDWIDKDGSSIQMDFRDVYMNQMFPT